MDDPAIQQIMLPMLRQLAGSDEPAEIAHRGGHLASALRDQFNSTRSSSTLAQAKTLHLNAANNMNPQHREHAAILSEASKTLQMWAQTQGDHDAMAQAVDLARRALNATPSKDMDHVARITNLGNMLIQSFRMTFSPNDIQEAVSLLDGVYTNHTNIEHPYRAQRMNSLAAALAEHSNITSGNADLDRAEKLLREAIEFCSSQQNPAYAQTVNLALVLKSRFKRSNQMEDLDGAIALLDELNGRAGRLSPAYGAFDPKREYFDALLDRYEEIGNDGDLEKVQGLLNEMLKLPGDGEQEDGPELLGKRCFGMARAFQLKYERSDSLKDLEQAISLNDKCTSISGYDQSLTSKALGNLALVLTLKYDRAASGCEDMEILERAIAAVRKALPMVEGRRQEIAGLQLILVEALMARFHRLGNRSDLDEVISLMEYSDGPDVPVQARRLSAYGNALRDRFDLLGDIADLDHAVKVHIQAQQVDARPIERAIILTYAADVLHARSEYTGSSGEFGRAIEFYREALDNLPPDHRTRKKVTNNLAYSLRRRYEMDHNPNDLEKSIGFSRSLVVAGRPLEDSDPIHIHNLGVALMQRWRGSEEKEEMKDLDEAIELMVATVESTPKTHYHRPLRLQVLSEALNLAADQPVANKEGMIAKAIDHIEEALSLVAETHPDRGKLGYVLGMSLEKFQKMKEDDKVLSRSIAAYEQAAKAKGASPSMQVDALDSAARLHLQIWDKDKERGKEHLKLAKNLLSHAVNLLYMVSPRTLRRKDQQRQMTHFAGIPARAASLALECGDDGPESLKLLEKGRGIIANMLLETRMDEGKLEDLGHLNLVTRLRMLRDQIDRPDDHQGSRLPMHELSISEKMRTLQGEYAQLLQEIRNDIDGMESFLLEPGEQSMKELADSVGSIVTFNVTHLRCDAIITTAKRIYSIPLQDLHWEKLVENSKRLIQALDHDLHDEDYTKARRHMTLVLKWLWTAAVGPVLDSIGATTPSSALPSVYWIGSSLLHLFPLHAAGLEGKPGENAMDRVVSSYTPSMKALIYAQERNRNQTTDWLQSHPDRMLFVGMSTTPGQLPLKAVDGEEAEVKLVMGKNVTVAEPRLKAAVLQELSKHEIFHFAGHGDTESDPSESMLLLNDWQHDPLTVADLASTNLSRARFACLSACYTAASNDLELLDESIHLSSAVMLAGFPTVIGSLWQVRDTNTALLMPKLYSGMMSESNGRLDVERSKFVLHDTMLELREETRFGGKADPLVWAPYVHFGI